jgi:ABC-type nitrate/sulfonate/bicarbonate transport system substrate-binding protein
MKLPLIKTLSLAAVAFSAAFSHAADAIPVRIGYATAIHGTVARTFNKAELGKNHGLATEFTFFQYGPPQAEALVSGSLDVSFTSLVPTSSLLDKKPGFVKVIAGLGTSIHGVVVQSDIPAKTLADLKGRTIGVPFGSDSHVDLLVAIKEAGLKVGEDIKLQNLSPNEQAGAFKQKLVDAVLARPPVLEKLQQENGGREVKRWPHHLWVIARTDYLAKNPGVEEKLVAAIREAVVYVNQNPDQSAAWYAEDLRQQPAAVATATKLNPLLSGADLKTLTVLPSDELKAFAALRSKQLLDVGLTKTAVQFFSAP